MANTSVTFIFCAVINPTNTS